MKRFDVIAMNTSGEWENIGDNVTRSQIKGIVFRKRIIGYHSFVKTPSQQGEKSLLKKYSGNSCHFSE